MNTAARPLELRLRSELDLSGTLRFEIESRNALVGQLTNEMRSNRRRAMTVAIPVFVLVASALGYLLTT